MANSLYVYRIYESYTSGVIVVSAESESHAIELVKASDFFDDEYIMKKFLTDEEFEEMTSDKFTRIEGWYLSKAPVVPLGVDVEAGIIYANYHS